MKRIKSFILKTLYKFKGIILIIFYILLHPFEWCFINFKEYLQRRSELKKFNNAKKLADHMHASRGKRYHVLPKEGGIWEVVDNDYRKEYNKYPGVKKITVYDLLKMSRYSTK